MGMLHIFEARFFKNHIHNAQNMAHSWPEKFIISGVHAHISNIIKSLRGNMTVIADASEIIEPQDESLSGNRKQLPVNSEKYLVTEDVDKRNNRR